MGFVSRPDSFYTAPMVMLSATITGLAVAVAITVAIVWLRYLLVSGFFAFCTKVHLPGLYRGLKPQIRAEIAWSSISAAIYGAPAGAMLWWWQAHGGTRIYTDITAWPLAWWPLSVVAYLLIHDAWFYWTHRLMHIPRIYRLCHYVHHQSHPPTAWAAMSFHPIEALSGAFLIPALTLVIPIHLGALGLVMAAMTLFGVTNHLGWEIWPSRLVHGPLGTVVITARHHDQHHRRNRCNYGLYFRFWDQICATDRGFSDFGGHGHQRARSGLRQHGE